ncbi:beta-ketoacyl-[acyl-carrier-protein] synthase family protein [Streptomyces sp. NPDC004435]|uniref:beta-ketoacyl-[acyl-carrier-protein] synthase family protein n=1 Tax=Streptomyces sp. NPDC004435 TaxID=3364701 RepID=UPI00367C5B53
MSGRAVAVTGLGLVTPAGIGHQANWRRLCEGRSTARADPDLVGLEPQVTCRVEGFDPSALLGPRDARRLDRVAQFAVVAARQAVQHAGLALDNPAKHRIAVVMGCGMGGMTTLEAQHRNLLQHGPDSVSPLTIPMFLSNMPAAQVGIGLGTTGPNLVVNTACASGATAIGIGRQLLLDGQCDIVIAGASEAAITPLVVTAFRRMRALSRRAEEPERASRPFDADRDGFVIAEGAAALLLERPADARRRGARVLANLVGFAASEDAYHLSDPHPQGQGAEQAIHDALADAGASARDVHHINAHGTSTRLNDHIEAQVLRRIFGHAPAVTSTKGVTGHTLGAAGAVEAAYTVLALQHSLVPPTANLNRLDPEIDINIVAGQPRPLAIRQALSTSFGFGGQNAALVFASPRQRRTAF